MDVSINQLAIYALILVLGWLLGLLSRSGGAKWRRMYHEERTERLALEKSHADREATATARIATLEREAAAATAAAEAARATPPAAPLGLAGIAPLGADHDDLTRIDGIDPAMAVRLNEAGIHRPADLVALGDADAAMLETRLGIDHGTIARQEWREQAARLADGHGDGTTRFV